MALCQAVGADNYMLVAILHDHSRSDVRIVASNWIYDAIRLVGHQTIAALAESAHAAPPGTRPTPIVTRQAPSLGGAGSWDYVTETAVAEYSIGSQVWIQAQGVLITVVLSGVVALLSYLIVKFTVGLRVPEEAEREGLDITSHGETAYNR